MVTVLDISLQLAVFIFYAYFGLAKFRERLGTQGATRTLAT